MNDPLKDHDPAGGSGIGWRPDRWIVQVLFVVGAVVLLAIALEVFGAG